MMVKSKKDRIGLFSLKLLVNSTLFMLKTLCVSIHCWSKLKPKRSQHTEEQNGEINFKAMSNWETKVKLRRTRQATSI